VSDERVETEEDFILLKRFGYSATEALKRHPDGLPDHLLAQALGKTSAWVTRRYNAIVLALREAVGE
jgi:hypothetical protein